jgi:hypothetical protein
MVYNNQLNINENKTPKKKKVMRQKIKPQNRTFKTIMKLFGPVLMSEEFLTSLVLAITQIPFSLIKSSTHKFLKKDMDM